MNDAYSISATVKSESKNQQEEAARLQDLLYDRGGMAGEFEVLGNTEGRILVKFTRFLSEDEEYSKTKTGLLIQFLKELEDADPNGDWKIVSGPDFQD